MVLEGSAIMAVAEDSGITENSSVFQVITVIVGQTIDGNVAGSLNCCRTPSSTPRSSA